MGKTTKRKITEADRQASAKLKAIFNQRKAETGLTQEKLAEQWGVSQTLVSAYLNGRAALNYRALVNFADALRVHPTDIRTDLPEQQGRTDRAQNLADLEMAVMALIDYITDSIPGAADALTTRLQSYYGQPLSPGRLASVLLQLAQPPGLPVQSTSPPTPHKASS